MREMSKEERKIKRQIKVAEFFSAFTLIAMVVFIIFISGFAIAYNTKNTEVETLQQEGSSLIKKRNFRKITEFNKYCFLTVDNDTKIIYIINNQCSGSPFACPYLGEHGRPCKLNIYNQIEELSVKDVYGTE